MVICEMNFGAIQYKNGVFVEVLKRGIYNLGIRPYDVLKGWTSYLR
jgi:hypothetical protein